MRKIALSLIAAAVLCVGFGNVAYALQPSGMAYYDAGAVWPTYNCDSTTSAGKGSWFTYWQKGGAGGGYLESNFTAAGNPTPHPFSFNATVGDTKGDEGSFSNAGYSASLSDGALYSDDVQVPSAGHTLVYVASFACKGSDCSAGTGDCYNRADFTASTDSSLHFVYGAGILTAGLDTTAAFYNFGLVTLSTPAAAVAHPMVVGDSTVVGSNGGACITPLFGIGCVGKSGTEDWVHLSFPASIMPNPLGAPGTFPLPTNNFSAVGDPNGDLKHGVRILSTPLAPGIAVSTDYAYIKPALGTFDFAGAGAVQDEWGINGAGDVFVNHHEVDVYADGDSATEEPNTHYITQPMIGPDALNPGGVPILMHAGSWGPVGPGSPGAGGLGGPPTPATVVSFDADFDPRTGKVTLNWKSAAEQNLDGYNIWRELSLNGRPLGDKVNVGFVPATGPGEYSLTDEPDVKGFARLARGRPIDATYSLEEVNTDGTTNVIKTTSVQLAKNRARRSR